MNRCSAAGAINLLVLSSINRMANIATKRTVALTDYEFPRAGLVRIDSVDEVLCATLKILGDKGTTLSVALSVFF